MARAGLGTLAVTSSTGQASTTGISHYFKNTKIRESHQLELRAEFFNLFNHTQFTILPSHETGNVGSPNFGRITSTREPFARVIQFGLRYRF